MSEEPSPAFQPTIAVQCDYTLSDIQESIAAIRRKMRRANFPLVLIYMTIIGTAYWFLTSPSGSPTSASTQPVSPAETWLPLMTWMIVWAVVIVLGRWWRRRWANRQLNYFGPLQRPHTFEFQPDRVLIHEPLARHEYQWDAFDRWAETGHLFLLYLSEYSPSVVTKRSFTGEKELIAFRDLLRLKIDQPKSSRKAFPVIPVATIAEPLSQSDNSNR